MTGFYSSRNYKPDEYEYVKKLAETENKKAIGSQWHLQFSGHNNLVWNTWKQSQSNMSRFPYNPPKCSSASSLSGCIHWFLSKTIIALPTKAEIVELFEKTLMVASVV